MYTCGIMWTVLKLVDNSDQQFTVAGCEKSLFAIIPGLQLASFSDSLAGEPFVNKLYGTEDC